MKKFVSMAMLVSLCVLVACNKKQDEEDRTNVIGSWTANFQTISGCNDGSNGTQEELTCTFDNCILYTFDAEGVYIMTLTQEGEAFGEQGTYAIKEGKISLCQEDEGELLCTSGTFDVSANSFILNITDEDTGCVTHQVFDRQTEEEEEEPAI